MSNKERIRDAVKNLTLFDDDLFRKASEDEDFCEEIVRVFLEDPALHVVSHQQQRDVKNLQGRSVNLDLLCVLSTGKSVNVEVQKASKNHDYHFRRVRYNSACVTANITDPGTNFENVPDLIMIYVTPFDIFKNDKNKYISRKIVCGTELVIDDGSFDIYINAEVFDDSKIARLMQVFKGDRSFRKEFPITNKILRRFTEEEEGIQMMSDIIEKIWCEEAQQIRKEAKEDARKEIMNELAEMIKNNCSIDDFKRMIKKEQDQNKS